MSSVDSVSIRSPASVISPDIGIMLHSARKVVVLPAPLAPRIAAMPPSSSENDSPCRTFEAP